MASPRYPSIGDYALLSDCHSAALVSRWGSVDWACLRDFDGESAFGRLLDWDRGGAFTLDPVDLRGAHRRYLDATQVLETTFETDGGTARILDALTMIDESEGRAPDAPDHQLLRIVEGVDGTVTFDVDIVPRFAYGELRPWFRAHDDAGTYSAVGGQSALVIQAGCGLDLGVEDDRLLARFTVEAGERVRFSVVAQPPHRLDVTRYSEEELDRRLEATLAWWREWSDGSRVEGPYGEAVQRSALVLKALTCAPTGAMVAAPTTSLPERIGGVRNWDYRYVWIRDATLMLAALDLVGHSAAAREFRDFLMRTAAANADDLHVMYGVYGRRDLIERELDLEGYRGSRPVRIGNEAYRQQQHDLYGYILDAAHLWQRGHERVTAEEWRFLRGIVERAAEIWKDPDQGIWEVRGEPRHFTHSKVQTWVALDRGIRLIEEGGVADGHGDLSRWRSIREEIRGAVEEQAVHPDGYFTQAFGGDAVDAALLELPLVGFLPATDPRMCRTVEEIQRRLAVPPHGFVRRYDTSETDDGLPGTEGVFLLCTFWLVDNLAMQGRVDEACALFDRLVATANDVGLMAEQCDPETLEPLGNFPQAFSHMGLINSAHQIACARRHAASSRATAWSTADRLGNRDLA